MTDVWNPLHQPGRAETHWSTVNVGEALPGVATPLGWSIWSDIGDRMCRDLSYAIGVFDSAERMQPAAGPDRIITTFFGRIAMRSEWLATVGDRMPGTTGAVAIAGMLGEAPPTMTFAPTMRRYPVIAYRLPYAALTMPGRVRRLAPQVDAWWRNEIPRLTDTDLAGAVAIFDGATRRFSETMTAHGIALFAAITPLVNALTALVKRTGIGDVGVLSGTGGAEMSMIEDIWKASRGELTLEQVVANQGFHGPLEGEISSRVWRENPAPVAAVIQSYAATDEEASPLARERAARARLPKVQAELLAALPATARPGVRLLLNHAARTIPLRGVGKASFLQALDVARASARRVGEHLTISGALADASDVFYLTVEEIVHGLPGDVQSLVDRRRERRAEYQRLELPSWWRGTPQPTVIQSADDSSGDDVVLTGIAAGSGVVEGPVRVIHDPAVVEVEPGEILVAPTTDPSWASIMFVSSALVVDIGSVLSHAAVVARELGLPCVVNTRTGTRRLRDGDLVRVDGTAGTVQLIKRAEK
ncbi:PEP-utilizing enzyme [Mycobacterium sp.]|uniref:PEP-utilizing enzyme n=1 Tax=Mycobacterium sp. TaxID=1785 RepID=UPI0012259167|nr:PEP-utilizing enzyme [Mycobacterium sp.]TAM65688.1 MAG: PEP-utilizing protein mobile subunit [Mycobacterium sp.]